MTTPDVLQTKITKFETNLDRLDDIVNADNTTDVTIDSGTVPSIAKLILEIQTDLNSANVIAETQNHRDDAEGWAITPEDTPFTDSEGVTGFSALHYAAKAAAASGGVEITASDTTAGPLNTKLLVSDLFTKTVGNPGGNETLTIDADIATQVEAETGTATDKLMNPLRTAQAIAALATAPIADGAVTTAKLADNAVNSAKLGFAGDTPATSAASNVLMPLIGSSDQNDVILLHDTRFFNRRNIVQRRIETAPYRVGTTNDLYADSTEFFADVISGDGFAVDDIFALQLNMVCVTADAGYTPGQILIIPLGMGPTSNAGVTCRFLTTGELRFRIGSGGIEVIRGDSFSDAKLTDNSWRIDSITFVAVVEILG